MRKHKKVLQPKVDKVSTVDKVDIILDYIHYHKGEECAKGSTISVSPTQADWLEEIRIGFRKKTDTFLGSSGDVSG
ncbi:MAG: hypothetical protein KAH32_02675 [Chlamydiia bacterium]|nr:hypothetical protein [Chlamydiia bacterium]